MIPTGYRERQPFIAVILLTMPRTLVVGRTQSTFFAIRSAHAESVTMAAKRSMLQQSNVVASVHVAVHLLVLGMMLPIT